MKYMIISDIHGDIYNLEKVLSIYREEKCFKLLILGDLFNYGFDLKSDEIINELNIYKDKIVYVRGNCDNNLNGILFDTPYITTIKLDDNTITLTHGHLFDKNYLLNLESNIIACGHSHIASIEKINNKIFINPGSISRPRSGGKSFIIIDNKTITIRDLDNNIIKEYNI